MRRLTWGGAKAAKKGKPGAVGRCVMAANEVQEAVIQRTGSVVAKAASCHVEYQEHAQGPGQGGASRDICLHCFTPSI